MPLILLMPIQNIHNLFCQQDNPFSNKPYNTNPGVHTALFQRLYNVQNVGTTLYGHSNDFVCVLGYNTFILVISLFLNLVATTTISYKYQCQNFANVRMSCYETNTNLNLAGGGQTIYLDRQNVRCKLNYGLSKVRLFTNQGKQKVAYKYKCCTIKSKFLFSNVYSR